MPRRKTVRTGTGRPTILERLLPTSSTLTSTTIEPALLVRGRAIDVLSTMPSRYITTKSVLDTYLDAIGVGR